MATWYGKGGITKTNTSGTMSNIDIRGVKRGACRNCDCEEYMFKCSTGPPCYYCSCPPTRHVKLDQPTGIQQTEPDCTSSNFNQHSGIVTMNIASANRGKILVIQPAAPQLANILQDGVVTTNVTSVNRDKILEIQPAASQLSSKLQDDVVTTNVTSVNRDEILKVQPAAPQLSNKLEDLESLLPKKLPKLVEIAIQNNQLTSTLRCRIVRLVAELCFEANVGPKVVDMVADIAVERWSPLKSQYGHKSKAFASQVKRRIHKLKYFPLDQLKKNMSLTKQVKEGVAGLSSLASNHDEETEYDSALHDRNLQLMNNEMQKTLPSKNTLKICLNGVRFIRQIRALNMSAAEHLKLYPALKYQDLLLWEFCNTVQVAVADMEKRWSSCLAALERYLDGSRNAVPQQCISDDMKTVHVLSVLPIMLPSGKKTSGASKLVLELYPENSKLSKLKEIVPEPSEPPRLIGIGHSSQADLHLTCFVDKTPLFTEQGVKALLMLLAAYWVFDIKLISEVKPSYLFFFAVILQRKFHSPHLSKTPSVTGLLKQLNLLNK